MNRREFMVQSGTILTAASFLAAFPSVIRASSLSESTDNVIRKKRPTPDDFKQPVLKAIAYGINAPSPHNVQSWKFEILSDTEMRLYADENRLLPATDPPSRQIHIGLGCFAEMLSVGASSFSYETEIKWFPEGVYGNKDTGKKPAAHIKLKQRSGLKVHELFEFTYQRQSNRRPYEGSFLTNEELSELKKIAVPTHGNLFFINEEKEVKSYLPLFLKAFEVESKTFRTNEETRLLFRFSEKERAESGYGISIPQMGYSGLAKFFAEKSLAKGDKEKWHSNKSVSLSLKGFEKSLQTSKGLVFFKTNTNTPEDWVKTGQDYLRFNLALSKLGFQTHPYNQIIQEYEEMKALRDKFNKKIGCNEAAKIQMIGRLGRAKPAYYSYRLGVKEGMKNS